MEKNTIVQWDNVMIEVPRPKTALPSDEVGSFLCDGSKKRKFFNINII